MILNISTKEELLGKLSYLYQKFMDAGDHNNADKMKQLILKVFNEEYSIAFCGHFSAGKSSMINYLMGKKILPSSPIPTSANTVKLQKGEDYAKVYSYTENTVLFPAPYDFQTIKNYCKDGENISGVTISSSDFPLPGHCTVLDTPGIDSTDDAHRVATESTLHLADAVFYVMDYNHVQSEVNFHFTKQLIDEKKPVFLVINMIDKHDENELSFDDFRLSVIEAFHNWQVYPDGIFYTSLTDLDSELNEINGLRDFIINRANILREENRSGAVLAAQRLIDNHLQWVREKLDEENAAKIGILSELSEGEKTELKIQLKELRIQQEKAEAAAGSVKVEYEAGLETILKNAYIMPAATRDLARDYLESLRPDFKVGLLFSKNKTEQERCRRQDALVQDLQEKTKTQLEWHLKELAVNTLKKQDIQDPILEKAAQDISLEISPSVFEGSIKAQTHITGEFILNYTNDLATAIKRIARDRAATFLGMVIEFLENQADMVKQQVEKQLLHYSSYQESFEVVEKLNSKIIETKTELFSLLEEGWTDPGTAEKLVSHWLNEEKYVIIKKTDNLPFEKIHHSNDEDDQFIEHEQMKQNPQTASENVGLSGKEKLLRTASLLKETSLKVKELKGFQSLTKELSEKASRLENQTFTVALFGAFSAGKSSFANALMGESVLPVSPNPTTAAINRIKASDSENRHGTARVRLKTADMLLADASIALTAFDMSADTLERAMEKTEEVIKSKESENRAKTHLSFLKAFYYGLPELKDSLGKELIVDLEGFRAFAAEETKSCFVDIIELYYDCELTKQGMVLVDTPGADSINARHTGAAFEYIKNADAILFVTYYNHPFSKADREFLIQLGRVKDSFAMDKMFFIINAVDLANTKDELQEVYEYVQSQLGGFGIRHPKLFPLSSKGALMEKTKQGTFQHHFLRDSGIHDFQSQFNRFIEDDLTDLAITAARNAINRTRLLLDNFVKTAKQDEEQKKQAIKDLDIERGHVGDIVNNIVIDPDLLRLRKEVDELAFYSKQRVFFRFSDFFKESFNPAVLKDDGRDIKIELKKALMDFLKAIGFDLAQEMRATALRTEMYTKRLLQEKQVGMLKKLKEVRSSLDLREYEIPGEKTMEFVPAFEQLTDSDFKGELSLFKNPKAFFEKNEKIRMMEALQGSLEEPAVDYTAVQADRMYTEFCSRYTQNVNGFQSAFEAELEEIYEGLHSVLSQSIDIPFYEKISREIEMMLE
ncbi:dynamin family protein [Peribacillus sp. SCS-155]|uniref:dynamin family protein n=1 Tax=Peribacillus sedimenti TaxID=3115297 RepID=UPI003905B736